MFRTFAPGRPAPQGSKAVNRRTGMMFESSKLLPAWRRAMDMRLTAERVAHHGLTFTGPVVVSATFIIPRPKSHYRTGRNAALLRESAPRVHTQKPDLDKLVRAVLDALTRSGLIADDAQVSRFGYIAKQWAEYGEQPGADIAVRSLED